MRDLVPLASLLQWAADKFIALGSDRGGMLVEAQGALPCGRAATGTSLIIAEAGDGPYIPILPAVVALRLIADGRMAAGVHVCAGQLSYDSIVKEFSQYAIRGEIGVAVACDPLYARVLGKEAFSQLPPAIQAAHNLPEGAVTKLVGVASVSGPPAMLPSFLRWLLGFPAKQEVDQVVQMTMANVGGVEIWSRTFGSSKRVFTSRFAAESTGRVTEGVFALPGLAAGGLFKTSFHLIPQAGGLRMQLQGCSVFSGIPVPRFLCPSITAAESVDDQGRFNFDVSVSLLGTHIVSYSGWLQRPAV